MQICEYRNDCSLWAWRQRQHKGPCVAEAENWVVNCSQRKPMPGCGHPRLYAREGDYVPDEVVEQWCEKCREEYGIAMDEQYRDSQPGYIPAGGRSWL